ncbi:Ku protein [Alsobacter soli]|uniref:Non-homologous end joining protein Ku n=1 Tax=Alsobacter soli TaxID=2109933 RepID=A0A2T1HUH2_9HYPH|nr:Ku protein [Alsobacter soli]PSC05169.1 Ku protein [Alsobacter soli]
MAPRANWKGYLKLSLVSCAVALYPASTAASRIAFHTVNRETGNRLRRQMFDPDTGDVVESENQVRGYEVAKGDYVIVEDEEIDAIALESTHTIDIESFVPRSEIDELYVDAPYYLAPDDRVAQEAFAVIREAMRQEDVVGIARVVLYRRERILMLEPRGKGLFAATLRYPYEVRQPGAYFDDIPDVTIPPDMLDLASHIIGRMKKSFDPAAFQDRYEDALINLVKAKQSGRAAPAATAAPRPSNVVNLMDALRRSLESEQALAPEGRARKAPGGKAPSSPKAPAKESGAPEQAGARGTAKPLAASKPVKKAGKVDKSAPATARGGAGGPAKGGRSKKSA